MVTASLVHGMNTGLTGDFHFFVACLGCSLGWLEKVPEEGEHRRNSVTGQSMSLPMSHHKHLKTPSVDVTVGPGLAGHMEGRLETS